MCLIIDANCAAKFASGHREAAPIAIWLVKKSGRLVVGGTKLKGEYNRVAKFAGLLAQLSAAGKIKFASDSDTDRLEQELSDSGLLISDDPHILALARVSGARVLYSNDQNLHADFCSGAMLTPRGSVYQNETHAHLLAKAVC